MGKLKAHQEELEYKKELAAKKARRKKEAIEKARETLKYKGFHVVEYNESLHFRVEGVYDFYPTTGRFKHMHWVNVRGRGLDEFIEVLEQEKTDKIVYSFCPSCRSRYPHRESEKFSHCNRCFTKKSVAEAEARRVRLEAERAAAHDEPEVVEFIADWETPCSTCDQVPSIKNMDMCAACTFGEAQAQQDLMEGRL